jgi:hypothetical protein
VLLDLEGRQIIPDWLDVPEKTVLALLRHGIVPGEDRHLLFRVPNPFIEQDEEKVSKILAPWLSRPDGRLTPGRSPRRALNRRSGRGSQALEARRDRRPEAGSDESLTDSSWDRVLDHADTALGARAVLPAACGKPTSASQTSRVRPPYPRRQQDHRRRPHHTVPVAHLIRDRPNGSLRPGRAGPHH